MELLSALAIAPFSTHAFDTVVWVKQASGVKEHFLACYYNEGLKHSVIAMFNTIEKARSYLCDPENGPEPMYLDVVVGLDENVGLCKFLRKCREVRDWISVPNDSPVCACFVKHIAYKVQSIA